MTMEQVQAMAVQALTVAVEGTRPKIYVHPYDGILSMKESRITWRHTPALLVSPLSVDDQCIKLAVYSLFTATDAGQVAVLDTVTRTLRSLSGVGRPYLKVAARSLYDKDALAVGLRLWVHLADSPHLAFGDAVEAPSGPVGEEKQRIRTLLRSAWPPVPVATTQAEVDELTATSRLPFLTVLAGEGKFEPTERRTISYEQDGRLWARNIKGLARWPIAVKAYARSEQEAESLLWPVLPDLPRIAMVDGVNLCTVVAAVEGGSQESGASVATVTLNLEVPAATVPKRVPTFKKSVVCGG